MIENPNRFVEEIDWSSVNRASFYSTRGDVSSKSNEATLYSRKGLPFVIKQFTDLQTIQAYLQTGINLKGLVPEMASYESIVIKVDNRPTRLKHCIVQQKIAPLNFVVDGKSNNDENSSLAALIEDKIRLDEEIFSRGFFVPDPKFLNYGLDNKGKVKLLDLGGVVEDPFCDEQYLKRLLIRGSGHYFNYLALQVMFSRETLIPTSQGKKLATKYQELVQLVFDDKVDARTFFRSGPYLHNLAKSFGSSLIKVSLEEISRLPKVKIPNNAVINAALTATPQNWIVYQNGDIGLLS